MRTISGHGAIELFYGKEPLTGTFTWTQTEVTNDEE